MKTLIIILIYALKTQTAQKDNCPLTNVDLKVVELDGKYRQNLELEYKEGIVSFSCASNPDNKIDLDCMRENILGIFLHNAGERKPYSNYAAREVCMAPCKVQDVEDHYRLYNKHYYDSKSYSVPVLKYPKDLTEVKPGGNMKFKCKSGFMSNSRGKKIHLECHKGNARVKGSSRYFDEEHTLHICLKYCKGKSPKNAGTFVITPNIKRFAVGESATVSCSNVDYQESEAFLVCGEEGWLNTKSNIPVVNMASPCEHCSEIMLKSYPGFDKLEMGPRYVRDSESYFLSQCKDDKFLVNLYSTKYILFKCNLNESWSYGIIHDGTIHYNLLGDDKDLLKCSKLTGECDLSGKKSEYLDWNNLKRAKNGTSFKCVGSDVRISVLCGPDGKLKFTHFPSLEPTDLGDEDLINACYGL